MSKSFRKIAKKLLQQAYEREQAKALESLGRGFDQWKSGEIDCWELTERIHQFHNGTSRELYKLYEMGDTKMTLARAIALDVIDEEEIPASLRESMRQTIEYFRDTLAEDAQRPDEQTR